MNDAHDAPSKARMMHIRPLSLFRTGLVALATGALALAPASLAAQAAAAAIPNLQAMQELGRPLPADRIAGIEASVTPVEGQASAVIDGNPATYVRHDPQIVAFRIDFKEPIALRAVRIFTDVVDSADVQAFNGDRALGRLRVSQPYQSGFTGPGQEAEFYILKYNGEEPVTRVEISVDYFKDDDPALHRLFHVDFLAGAAPRSVRLVSGENVSAELSGEIRLATLRGIIELNASDVARIDRGQDSFAFRLQNGSRISGVPTEASVKAGGQSLAWKDLAAYQAAAKPRPLSGKERAIVLGNGDVLVGSIEGFRGRALDAGSLEEVKPDWEGLDSAQFQFDGRMLRAALGGDGALILSRDASLRLRFAGKGLELNCRDIQSIAEEAPQENVGGEIFENLTGG